MSGERQLEQEDTYALAVGSGRVEGSRCGGRRRAKFFIGEDLLGWALRGRGALAAPMVTARARA
jgi:hypothetical protein